MDPRLVRLAELQQQRMRPDATSTAGLYRPKREEAPELPGWLQAAELGADIVTPGPLGAGTTLHGLYNMARGYPEEGAEMIGADLALGLTTAGVGNRVAKARKLKKLAEVLAEGGEATTKTAAKAAEETAAAVASEAEQRAQQAIFTSKGKPRGQEKFGVLTAENMGGQPGKKAQNRAAMEALDKSLERRGLAGQTVPVKGAYTDETTGKTLTETGRMIVGATPYEIETLGRQFGQNSVLSEKGLHDLVNRSVVPSRGTLRAETLPKGAPYTQLPTGERISLDLNWNQSRPLADAAPGLAKYAEAPELGPRAPFVLLPPSSGTVLNEANLGRVLPDRARMERAPTKYPQNPDWDLIDPVTARFRTKYTPAVLRGIKENPKSLGWYDTTELANFFEDYAPEGIDDFRLAMRLTSPPSAGTRVFPENLRMGSWAYEQAKKGKLTPDALQGEIDIPEGYRHRFQSGVNRGWERILRDGKLDPFEQPKTYRHAEVPALENWWNVALDRHLGRTVGEKGLLYNKATEAYDTPGVGFPEPSYATTRRIDTSPTNTHYSMIEDGLLDEAARLGLAPPQYMAAGWVGNAKKTGVDDTRTLVELYNEMFRRTGQKYGISPLEAAKQWAGGGLPLWVLLGGVGLGSAAQSRQDTTSSTPPL